MATKPQWKRAMDDRANLLTKVPPGAKRVLVLTKDGARKYKDRDQLDDLDTLVLNETGVPIVMMTAPGRPAVKPLAPVNADVAAKVKAKAALTSTDALARALRANPEDPSLLNHILGALTEEVTSIKFEREEAERDGRDTSGLSVKRIQGLSALANTWLKHRELTVAKEIDLRSPSFQAAVRFMMETFKESMLSSGLRPEMIEAVFAKASMSMAKPDWESEARSRMAKA